MVGTARHQEILRLLKEEGHVSAGKLSRHLGVTAMTVWRDLKLMEELGHLHRVRGGATLADVPLRRPAHEARAAEAVAVKSRIAARAAREFIHPGDVVALAGGSTVAAITEHLPESRISVLTISLPVALAVRERRPALPVHLPGGWLSNASGCLCGPPTLRMLEKSRASVCFLSAYGLDAGLGPTDPHPLDTEANRALASVSRKVVLLLDSRKFGLRSSCVTLHLRRVHCLVTDARPPRFLAAALREHGVRVIVC